MKVGRVWARLAPFRVPRPGRAGAWSAACDHAKHDPEDRQDPDTEAAPQRRGVRSVEQFDVIDVVVVVTADILLGDETGGEQRRE